MLPTHTFYEGGGGGGGELSRPHDSENSVDSTTFNFGRLLGLSVRDKKTGKADDISLVGFAMAAVLFEGVFDLIFFKNG